jgi:glutaredoxin
MVTVYGKDGCGLCDAAKDKLTDMGVRFNVRKIADLLQVHEGWRTDDTTEVQACYVDINTLPVIVVDGKAMSYPKAMKLLKPKAAVKPAVKLEKKVVCEQPAECELELAVA